LPVLPARRAAFLTEDLSNFRDIFDIPAGYRNWGNEIDPNFYGGVICMTRSHFEQINGFNPLYKGWGNEDEDLRERFKWANITVKRNTEGTFYCLHHADNGDMVNQTISKQQDFINGRNYLMHHAYADKHIGYKNVSADIIELTTNVPNLRWLKSNNYQITTI
jgi:hypothetical protein